MSGWWRSNAIALGALVLLVPATVMSISWNEWANNDAYTASRPLTLAPGDTIQYGGVTVGPASAEFTDSPLAPQGTRVVSVSLRIDPGETSILCSEPPLHEMDGAMRQWNSASYELDRGWDVNHPTSCIDGETRPYTLEVDYLVPSDAVGPFAVEFSLTDALPEFVSAVVEP